MDKICVCSLLKIVLNQTREDDTMETNKITHCFLPQAFDAEHGGTFPHCFINLR